MRRERPTSLLETDKHWVLACAKEENQSTTKNWIEGFHAHTGDFRPNTLEACIAEGLVTIGEDQIVRTTPSGLEWLASYNPPM